MFKNVSFESHTNTAWFALVIVGGLIIGEGSVNQVPEKQRNGFLCACYKKWNIIDIIRFRIFGGYFCITSADVLAFLIRTIWWFLHMLS